MDNSKAQLKCTGNKIIPPLNWWDNSFLLTYHNICYITIHKITITFNDDTTG